MSDHAGRVAAQLQLIESELRALELWQTLPPSAEALASDAPFCVDTLAFDQWLQWVLLPRVKALLEGGHHLPTSSAIKEMAEEVYRGQLLRFAPLLTHLAGFDALLREAR